MTATTQRAKRNYDLVAIDLDGTMLNSRGEVSRRNLDAVQSARAAGMRVLVCTGRGLAECRHVLTAIQQQDPVVVAGGAIIACPATSSTLHRFAVDEPTVARAVSEVLAHDHPALVLKDPAGAGYDYLVVHGEKRLPLDPVTEWWFSSMQVRVRRVQSLAEDEHPEHSVRVGACGMSGRMARVKESLHASISPDIHIHHFPAVVAPQHVSRTEDGQTLHVLEMFSRHANKWSAISHVSEQWRIPASRIAAIGDEINDVSMIRGAGLGIAMANAVPAVREVAKRSTLGHNDDGVADALSRILTGEW